MAISASLGVAITADIRSFKEGTEEAERKTKKLKRAFYEASQSTKDMQRIGVPALSALSAGFSAASSSSDGFNTSMAAVASSMLASFASGGPVGLALAATSTAIGVIVSALGRAKREGDLAAEAIKRSRDELAKEADVIDKQLITSYAKLQEVKTGGAVKASDILRGVARADQVAQYEGRLSSMQRVMDEKKAARDAAWLEYSTRGLGSFAKMDKLNREYWEAARAVAIAATNLARVNQNISQEDEAEARAAALKGNLGQFPAQMQPEWSTSRGRIGTVTERARTTFQWPWEGTQSSLLTIEDILRQSLDTAKDMNRKLGEPARAR